MVRKIKQRKLNRLKDFDYSSSGWYFVTICTKNREEYFGNITNGKMFLNQYGMSVKKFWYEIPFHYKNVEIDEFIIMPNHVHGIIVIHSMQSVVKRSGIVGTIHELSLHTKNKSSLREQITKRRNMLIPKMIGFFKMNTSKSIHQKGKYSFQWQRSFYDHIIRNEQSLSAIRQYIRDNPSNWVKDRNNVENLYM